MKDEYRIKQLPRQDKQKLCREYEEEQRKLQGRTEEEGSSIMSSTAQ